MGVRGTIFSAGREACNGPVAGQETDFLEVAEGDVDLEVLDQSGNMVSDMDVSAGNEADACENCDSPAQTTCCVSKGDTCAFGEQCCSGKCRTDGTCACSADLANVARLSDAECNQDSDCCAGKCLANFASSSQTHADQRYCCVRAGQPGTTSSTTNLSGCCSGRAPDQNGVCPAALPAAACSEDADCVTGHCVGGHCARGDVGDGCESNPDCGPHTFANGYSSSLTCDQTKHCAIATAPCPPDTTVAGVPTCAPSACQSPCGAPQCVTPADTACCGTLPYDPKTQICCGGGAGLCATGQTCSVCGQSVRCDPAAGCPSCATCMNCAGGPIWVPQGSSCCGRRYYNVTQACCGGEQNPEAQVCAAIGNYCEASGNLDGLPYCCPSSGPDCCRTNANGTTTCFTCIGGTCRYE
jgi:hypothetical protein